MSKLKNLYCFVGESGSGKTTIVDKLSEEYGYNVLRSYTTRPKRNEGDTDHTYITVDEFKELDNKVAAAEFDGNYYCATEDQVNNADLYVVDLAGLSMLRNSYKGDKRIIAIYLSVPMEERLNRMLKRGDKESAAWQRLKNDYEAFCGASCICDVCVNGNDELAWKCVEEIIELKEGETNENLPIRSKSMFER